MSTENVVKALRALWRTDRIIADIRLKPLLVSLGLRAFAALIAAFGLLMLELAAYFALVQIWSAISAAAVLGLVCVALGAFAAHAITDPRAQAWARTGAEYGFVHVLASLACVSLSDAGAERARFAPRLFLPGVAIFTGTLAAMALGGPLWLGAITPVGGVLFMAGWAVVAWSCAQLGR